jgi:ribonuclease P protein component
MLPAERRIRHREEFTQVVRRGARLTANGLVLHVATAGAGVAGPVEPARAGFVVGRAVGPAVARNRLRRRLRHLMASRLSTLAPGTAVVVRVTPAARSCDYAGLGDTLDALLARAHGSGAAARPAVPVLPRTP